MKINNIDIDAALEKARMTLSEEKELSAATRSMVEILILIITLLVNSLNLNSKNSSKPPSTDPNRTREGKDKTGKKPGGQKGHVGTTLKKVDTPDKIEIIEVDRNEIPPGDYKQVGFESRQVFDIEISRIVTEYQAEIIEDAVGNRFTAPFPKGVTKSVQYGTGAKAQSVYLSQYQLIPYNRIQDYFTDQVQMPISEGSIFNFNSEAFDLLESVDARIKNELAASDQAHADETGINIGGKRHWLHCVSNDSFTSYFPHPKRGIEAMNDMDILPRFKGVLCHDHWKPYYRIDCVHALCNAHHLRELTRAFDHDGQEWAKKMRDFLENLNRKVHEAGGSLSPEQSQIFRDEYRSILKEGEIECKPPDEPDRKGKRGRIKKSKARNLLERLRDFEADTLRFMDNKNVPFSNNQGENDIRMTKVQQKISGCFRSLDGSKIFCRIRSYLSTCRKNGIKATHALDLLFDGKLPDFLM